MSNAEKQARHRKFKALAIAWYEKATGFTLREVMDLHKIGERDALLPSD